MTEGPESARTQPEEPSDRAAAARQVPDWAIIALACIGQFMVILDVSIVNVALPSIQHSLGYSESGLQWVVTAYTLTFAGFLLLGGRLADLYGRRRIFIGGLLLFTLASLACGLADTPALLIAGRAAQGLAGAALAPATLTLLTTTFPSGPRRARAIGIWSGVMGAGGAVGSLAGGLLTDFLSWRWIFLVNIPVGIAAVVVASLILTEQTRERASSKLDVAGAVTVTAGLALFVFAIGETETGGMLSRDMLLPLLIALGLLAGFVLIEARVASHPLLPLNVFRIRSVSVANLAAMLMGSALFGFWFLSTLYMQNVLGFTPLETGLAFVPHSLAIVAGSQITARLLSRFGNRAMMLSGLALAIVGFFAHAQLNVTADYFPHVFVPGVLVAFGMGLVIAPMTGAATEGVGPERSGLVSGLLNTSRQMGGSLGLGLLATVAAIRSSTALASDPGAVAQALSSGYTSAYAVGGAILIAAFAVSLMIPRHERAAREPVAR